MLSEPWIRRMMETEDSKKAYMHLDRVLSDVRCLDGGYLPDIAKKMQNYIFNGDFNGGWENGVRKYSWRGYDQ